MERKLTRILYSCALATHLKRLLGISWNTNEADALSANFPVRCI